MFFKPDLTQNRRGYPSFHCVGPRGGGVFVLGGCSAPTHRNRTSLQQSELCSQVLVLPFVPAPCPFSTPGFTSPGPRCARSGGQPSFQTGKEQGIRTNFSADNFSNDGLRVFLPWFRCCGSCLWFGPPRSIIVRFLACLRSGDLIEWAERLISTAGQLYRQPRQRTFIRLATYRQKRDGNDGQDVQSAALKLRCCGSDD